MRSAFVWLAALIAVQACSSVFCSAEDTVKASATLEGKPMEFPEKGVAGGVKATTALLESGHDRSDGTLADLKKAQEGDHIRLLFAKPVTVTVGREKLEMTELVLTQPLHTGVFWLRVGDKIVRCTKYKFEKEQDFVTWRNEAKFTK